MLEGRSVHCPQPQQAVGRCIYQLANLRTHCSGRTTHERRWCTPGSAFCLALLRASSAGISPNCHAGATADALTLFERLESKLEEHSWQLTR